jgi:hypothetical protein
MSSASAVDPAVFQSHTASGIASSPVCHFPTRERALHTYRSDLLLPLQSRPPPQATVVAAAFAPYSNPIISLYTTRPQGPQVNSTFRTSGDKYKNGFRRTFLRRFQPVIIDSETAPGFPHMHRGSKAADRKSIAFDFLDPNSPSAVEVPHGRHAAADLPDSHVNRTGWMEFAYLVNLHFGPGTPQRLLCTHRRMKITQYRREIPELHSGF